MTATLVDDPSVDAVGAEGRVGGLVLGAGAILMIAGAVVWTTTGTDLWAALAEGSVAAYLADAEEHRHALFANLVIWILGATALGAGGALLAGGSPGPAARLARVAYPLGSAVAVVSFTLWIGLVRVGTSLDTATAELVGFGVTRLDDLATLLLIGIGPVLLAASAPSWLGPRLRGASWIVGLAAALSLLAIFTGAQMTYGFLIVPTGLAWSIAVAVSASRGPAH